MTKLQMLERKISSDSGVIMHGWIDTGRGALQLYTEQGDEEFCHSCRRLEESSGFPSRAQTQQAFLTTPLLLCPHSLLPHPEPHSCSFKCSGDPGICIYSTPTASLLKVTQRRYILPSVGPRTHSKKYPAVNNYFFLKQ